MRRRRVVLGFVIGLVLLGACHAARTAVRHDLATHAHDADAWLPVTFPVLWRWSMGPDTAWARRSYAVEAFYHRSPPLAQAWLQHQLKDNPSRSFVVPEQWSSLGWDEPGLACQNIRDAFGALDDRDVDTQFAGDMLLSVADDAHFSRLVEQELLRQLQTRDHFEARRLWDQWRDLLWRFPGQDCYQTAHALAARLFPERNDWYVREERLDQLVNDPQKATTDEDRLALVDRLSSSARLAFLRSLWQRPTLRPPAALDLWDEGDGHEAAAKAASDSLAGLCQVSPDVLWRVAETWPHSRFAQACREYHAIRGQVYFYSEPLWAQPAGARPWPPAEEARRWVAWLGRYPNHPGADDAGYWLGRCLEWQGLRLEALKQYADLLAHMPGDGDMADRIWQRFVLLLDVGTDEAHLREFLHRWPLHPMQAPIRYALSVQLARQGRFQEALALKAYLPGRVLQLASSWDRTPLDLLGMIDDQRRRWAAASADDRLALARRWAGAEGWKMSYLALWNGQRAELLGLDDPVRFCDVEHCPWERAGFRQANSAVIALRLLQGMTSPEALALRVDLIDDLHNYPRAETSAMVPLPGFPPADASLVKGSDEPDYDWISREAAMAALDLEHRYPHSASTQAEKAAP
ncbi:MAG TPA: hypothetical protein VGO93_06375 [Candidatus Xenobia bacterium]|jgi:hypothetical protein